MVIKTLDTVATVLEDGTVTLQLPADVPTGPHRLIVIIEKMPIDESRPSAGDFAFPAIEEAEWPDDMPICREDLYGDDGR